MLALVDLALENICGGRGLTSMKSGASADHFCCGSIPQILILPFSIPVQASNGFDGCHSMIAGSCAFSKIRRREFDASSQM